MAVPNKGRRIALIIVLGSGGVIVAGAVVWAVLLGASLYRRANGVSEQAAALQAIAAALGLVATVILVGVTTWYVVITRGILRQSGPCVDAQLKVGWLTLQRGSAASITGPLNEAVSAPHPDYPVRSFAVSIRNRGNAGTTVANVGIQAEIGFTYVDRPVAGPRPRFELGAHSGEIVCLDWDPVVAGVMAWPGDNRRTLRVRAEVTLGSGVVVHSKWESLPIAPADSTNASGV